MSCNIEVSNDITSKRHQAVCVAVESHEEPLRRSNKPTPPRILLEQGQCRKVWTDRSFPQLRETHGSQDCLITDMRPYRKRHAEEDGEDNGQDGGQGGGPGVNVDYMFGVEA